MTQPADATTTTNDPNAPPTAIPKPTLLQLAQALEDAHAARLATKAKADASAAAAALDQSAELAAEVVEKTALDALVAAAEAEEGEGRAPATTQAA